MVLHESGNFSRWRVGVLVLKQGQGGNNGNKKSMRTYMEPRLVEKYMVFLVVLLQELAGCIRSFAADSR